ncbi:MAG: hypothetical protein RBS39_12945 [Phycisphaerales bacterium]|jgi:hypothetical protein|nr:hypothetical protein [Phycisphaerales bacterium]
MRLVHGIGRMVRALAVLGPSLGLALLPGAIGVSSSRAMAQDAAQSLDLIIFRDGKTVEGRILRETDLEVEIEIRVGGISAPVTYRKSDILKVARGAGAEAAEASRTVGTREPEQKGDPADTEGRARVYVIELDGEFGKDISQTPIRDAVADARKNNATHIVFVMNNRWDEGLRGGLKEEALGNDLASFDQLFRAEDIEPIFSKDIEREWPNPPKTVFWVKQAMGGAAFLPLVCKNIYFAPDARMGGIGNLAGMFGGMGDEVVRQKQESLRMGHAEGMAIQGGYDPILVRAMARKDVKLVYSVVDGKVVLRDGDADASKGEIQVTDSGDKEEEDDIVALARGEGNDVLTINAEWARKLGVSKGTVSSIDDLLFELGIDKNAEIVNGRSDRIMDTWSSGVKDAERTLQRLWREFNETPVQGDYTERTRGRGIRQGKLNDMERLIRRYEESINPRRIGVPGIGDIAIFRDQLKLEQLRDKK